jgi:hypothetical protein
VIVNFIELDFDVSEKSIYTRPDVGQWFAATFAETSLVSGILPCTLQPLSVTSIKVNTLSVAMTDRGDVCELPITRSFIVLGSITLTLPTSRLGM